MARMSREFSLVLVGAGILTAGYFCFRDNDELFAKEEEQAKQQVSGRRSGGSHVPLIFLYGGSHGGNGRVASAATAGGTMRGGFGGIGAHTAGG